MQVSTYGLKRDARFIRDLDYVFVDVGGRLYRLDAERFDGLRVACLRGLHPAELAEVSALVEPCASREAAERSFREQELAALQHP
ncbi:MAG: hypothetical protein WD341_00950 [Tistlia sp.]|uniref:hypothetical protein n=1 Tax=Tistlia sp. TaxID=3057121 RepID=UPI0034A5955A